MIRKYKRNRSASVVPAGIAALLLITHIAAGCSFINPSELDTVRDEMRRVREQWRAQNIRQYELNVQTFCFCPQVRLLEVHVDAGVASSARYVDTGEPVPANMMDRAYSVDRLFQIIEEAIDRDADKLTVQYDQQLNYPTLIDIDYVRNAIDDEVRITASNVTRWIDSQRSSP